MTIKASNRSSLHVRAGGWRALLLLAGLLVLLLPGVAHAQGTGGSLPDPMSSRDLEMIMDRLELDAAQRRAIETFHEQYVEEFKRLREGDIEKFMEKQNAFQGSMPQRKELEDFISDMQRLQKRIAQVDNRFFDQVQTILNDQQQIMMTRVRLYRARQRDAGEFMQMIAFMIPSATIDLSELYDKLELTDDEELMMQPTIMDYESKLTRATKAVGDGILKMFINIFDIMEAAGFDETSFQDPEKMQEAMQMMREAWASVSAEVMKEAMEISDLNRKTCKRLTDMLLSVNGEELLIGYYQRAYPELPSSDLREQFKNALRHKDLTEEQWMNVSVQRDEFRRQEQNLYEDMADLQDTVRATRSPFDFAGGMGGRNAGMSDEMVDKLADLTERHTKLVERATEALNATLGEDLAVKVSNMKQAGIEVAGVAASPNERVVVDNEGNAVTIDEGESVVAADGNVFRSTGNQAIPLGEFRQIVGQMELDGASNAVAEQLHAAYVERFNARLEETQQAIMEAQAKMWRYDEATNTMSSPTPQQVQAMHELRKDQAAALREMDDAFYGDLAVSFGADPARQQVIADLRSMRRRASYANTSGMWVWSIAGENSTRNTLDLVALCIDARLLDHESAGVREVLNRYNADMTQAMQKRYDKGLEAQYAMDAANAERQAAAAQNEDEFDVASGMRYQQLMAEVSKKLIEANAEASRINTETLAALKAALNEDDAKALEKAYRRAAYPRVYESSKVIDRTMTKIRGLSTLSPNQRDSVEALLTKFETDYEAICDKMVTALDSRGDQSMWDTEGMRDRQRVESTIDKLEFERDELLARARRRVQDLLSDEQLAQVGGPFARKPAGTQ